METKASSLNARRAARFAARRGFTLIEVLLVIVIIGMLATVLIVTLGGQSEGAKKDIAEIKNQKLVGKIDLYQMNCGSYPPDLQALLTKPADENIAKKWRGPYVESGDLVDPWNNKFNYELMEAGTEATNSKRYKVWSNGPDGQSGNEDDIKNWTEGT